MLRSIRSVALALALGFGMFASAAQATVITFSTPATGTLTATSDGNNSTFSVSTSPLFGAAFSPLFPPLTSGIWTMSALPVTVAGPDSGGGLYPLAPNLINWNVTFSTGDTVGGTITWLAFQDDALITHSPRLLGTATINTLIGSPGFVALFSNPGSATADFTWNVFNTTLAALVASPFGTAIGGEITPAISGGEVVTQIPLPGALPLFATGMLGLWALGKRRKKQKVALA